MLLRGLLQNLNQGERSLDQQIQLTAGIEFGGSMLILIMTSSNKDMKNIQVISINKHMQRMDKHTFLCVRACVEGGMTTGTQGHTSYPEQLDSLAVGAYLGPLRIFNTSST